MNLRVAINPAALSVALLQFSAVLPAHCSTLFTPEESFQNCMSALYDGAEVLKGQVWHGTPLPQVVARVVDPRLYGDIILRWTSHQNDDGSMSYIIMRREPQPEDPEEDPNDFSLVIVRHGAATYLDSIVADGILFDKRSSLGVTDVFVCTDGVIDDWPLRWDGHDWEAPKGVDQ